jgi:hypothetical protein
MMLSATISQEFKEKWRKITEKPTYVLLDEGQLLLKQLTQFYIKVSEDNKQ